MRIAIIGHFGGNETFNDGQTIKTLATYDALHDHIQADIDRVDTYFIKRRPVKFILQFLSAMIRDRKYLVLLSKKGRRILFPILSFMSKHMKKEIYHYGIGGRLAQEVSESAKWGRYVSSFSKNWVESRQMADQLQKLGIKNAYYLPNFKKLSILTEEELPRAYSEPYRLCTFSRVMKEKGIEDAIDAVRAINEEAHRSLVTLDIYGPAEEAYLSHVKEILARGEDCRYCGVVPASESVETLKGYYALLFPTFWKAEGMPGTIIDALSAGVPVIARKWPYCNEMLKHGVTGYIYDFDKPEKLKDMILLAIHHADDTAAMRAECLKCAQEYSEENVVGSIIEQMGLKKRTK